MSANVVRPRAQTAVASPRTPVWRYPSAGGEKPPSSSAGRPTAVVRGVPRLVDATEGRLGTVLGDTYRIERLIATGGMGVVYEVVHLRLQQRFACKILEHQAARNDEAYARFRQEAEIAASLNHGSIVQVFDFNTDHCGNPYMVMELVDGVTLGRYIETNPPSLREVLRLFDPLCSALEAAHRAGIVHRDLKPSNIMVRRSPGGGVELKLLDFGISKMRDADREMTRDNVVMGTPNYMSPEQAQGHAWSAATTTDIFALGAILYETLARRRAFEGESTPELLHRIVYEEPVALATLRDDLPPGLVEVVCRCLQKQPDDRYATVRELFAGLREAIRPPRRATVAAVPPAAAEAGPRRGRGTAWSLAWALGVGVGGLATLSWMRMHAGDVAVQALPASIEPATTVARPSSEVRPRYGAELVTAGARMLELTPALYRGDARGLTFWADPEAPPVSRPLPSASPVTALSAGGEGDIWVGQADGTVSRWDREAHEPRWHRRFDVRPISTLASGADYLAIGTRGEVQLWNSTTGRALKRFASGDPVVALLLTRVSGHRLIVVRRGELEVIDADARRSVGSVELGDNVLRARLVAEPADGPPELELDLGVGDWEVRRRFRLVGGRAKVPPELEPIASKLR